MKEEDKEKYQKPKYETNQEKNLDHSKKSKIYQPSHLPKQVTGPKIIPNFPGFAEEFSQPSFSSFQLPTLDRGKSQFGLSNSFPSSFSWPGEQEWKQESDREGR